MKKLLFFTIYFIFMLFEYCTSKGLYQENNNQYFLDDNNEIIKGEIINYNDNKYYANDIDGHFESRFFLENADDGNSYYFDKDGKMIKNAWLCIKPDKVNNKCEYVPSVYWYYFQNNGKAIKATSDYKKVEIDGKKYLFNKYGQMLTGFVDAFGNIIDYSTNKNPFIDAMYFCGDDNDGIIHTGWYNYVYGYDTDDTDDYRYDLSSIYLYFNESSGKKVVGKKDINGKSYLFNDEGIMFSKWDALETGFTDEDSYYGEQDDGGKVKNSWIYTIPSYLFDKDAYDDEEKKYLYYDRSGSSIKNKIKKIENKYYVFDKNGIMKTGLVIFHENIGYIDTVDFDYANAEDFMKRGELATSEDKIFYIDYDGNASGNNVEPGYPTTGKVYLHYFNDDGSKQVGKIKLEFSDAELYFYSTNKGNYESQKKNKKYYANGVLLHAINDNKMGIVTEDKDTAYGEQSTKFYYNLKNDKYYVLDSKGKIIKGNLKSLNDDNENFWLIGGKTKTNNLLGIWTINVKYIKNSDYVFENKFDYNIIKNYNDDEIYEYLVSNNYINDYIFANDITSSKFIICNIKNNNCNIKIDGFDGYVYLDDTNENKKTWTPCGVINRENKTVSVSDYEKGNYQTEMCDEYFINCYWK